MKAQKYIFSSRGQIAGKHSHVLNRLSLPGRLLNSAFLIIIFFTMALPMWNVVVMSTSTALDASAGGIRLWWNQFSLDGYFYVFETAHLLRPFLNSTYVSITGTVIQVVLSCLAAYVLIQRQLPFKNAMVSFIMLSMMIPGNLILVSVYQLNKALGLHNSLTGLIINGLISGFGILLMRGYFVSVPYTMEESARIDGASDMKIFIHIYMPVSLPGVATIFFISFISRWNALMLPATLISDQKKYTLPLMLKTMILSNSSVTGVAQTPDNALMAAIVISAIPLLLIYVFAQQFLIAGMTFGAVKE